jgi:ribonuclease T2
MLDLMLEERLIRHEWAKHGTCSGLDIAGYFDRVRSAREKINVPAEFAALSAPLRTDAMRLQESFVATNPGMPPDAVAPICRGQYLSEVRICLTVDLQPTTCGADVRRGDCGGRTFTVRPAF